jgi:hypothetical protein
VLRADTLARMPTIRIPAKRSALTAALTMPCLPCEAEARAAELAAKRVAETFRPTVRINTTRTLLADAPLPTAPDPGPQAEAPAANVGDVPWAGVIASEGVPTGDGRVIQAGAMRWDQLPVPLRWCPIDNGMHDGAVVVGLINTVERGANGTINATGVIDTSVPEGAEVARRMSSGLLGGVSVDLDDMDVSVSVPAAMIADGPLPGATVSPEPGPDGRVVVYEGGSDDELMSISDCRLRAATLVDIPAFADARIALTAAATGSTDLPLGEQTAPWDGDDARQSVESHCAPSDVLDADCASKAFFYRDDTADATTIGAYKLPFARYDGDTLTAVWAGVQAVAAVLQGSQGGVEGLSDADRDAIKGHVASYYEKARTQYKDDTIQVPWAPEGAKPAPKPAGPPVPPAAPPKAASGHISLAAGPKLDALLASGVVLEIPVAPPAAWFANPKLSGPTPLTFTEDGRVYGHIALWNTCHTGLSGCVTPPRSATSYASYMTGALRTAEGTEISVGRLTMDTGHAPQRLKAGGAAAHYDNTGTAVADVRAGEDSHGIWIAGAQRPGMTDARLRALRSSPMSGDWRRRGTQLELMAILAVNMPGFPVPRAAHALVASGNVEALELPIQVNPVSVRSRPATEAGPQPSSGETAVAAPFVNRLQALLMRAEMAAFSTRSTPKPRKG